LKRSLLADFLRLFAVCALVAIPLTLGCGGGVETEPVGVDAIGDDVNDMDDDDYDPTPEP